MVGLPQKEVDLAWTCHGMKKRELSGFLQVLWWNRCNHKSIRFVSRERRLSNSLHISRNYLHKWCWDNRCPSCVVDGNQSFVIFIASFVWHSQSFPRCIPCYLLDSLAALFSYIKQSKKGWDFEWENLAKQESDHILPASKRSYLWQFNW